ncbi:MAG: hypothetical protein H0W08_15355 [Acidobacteria bacterium]|nr:hypothetical protein [Acidobacteriota bacterium]
MDHTRGRRPRRPTQLAFESAEPPLALHVLPARDQRALRPPWTNGPGDAVARGRACLTSPALDARLTYRPSWSGDRWAFYLDLVNLLNAENVVKIDSALVFDPTSNRPGIIERAEDKGIPFFPSFGIRFWF